jgi:hypothetical protein
LVSGLRVSELRVKGSQPLGRHVKQFQAGLVVKAHRPVHHSTLGWRAIQKKKKKAHNMLPVHRSPGMVLL